MLYGKVLPNEDVDPSADTVSVYFRSEGSKTTSPEGRAQQAPYIICLFKVTDVLLKSLPSNFAQDFLCSPPNQPRAPPHRRSLHQTKAQLYMGKFPYEQLLPEIGLNTSTLLRYEPDLPWPPAMINPEKKKWVTLHGLNILYHRWELLWWL